MRYIFNRNQQQKYLRLLVLGAVLAVACVIWNPAHTSAAPATSADPPKLNCDAKPRFFMLVPWYEYLTVKQVDTKDKDGNVLSSSCQVAGFDDVLSEKTENGKSHSTSPFLLVALAILDDLVRIAALVAVGFVIYGGIQYMTSQGSPESTKKAQQTIINALIGLVVAVLASSIVAYIGGNLGA